MKLKHYFKYGSDGSKGLPIFKQILDAERDQGAIYATGMVSMQIVAELENGQKAIIYNNSLVNSSLSWRPLRFLFKSETTEITVQEKERLEKERDELEDYEVFDGITVEHVGFYCMCDQKAQCLKTTQKKSHFVLLLQG